MMQGGADETYSPDGKRETEQGRATNKSKHPSEEHPSMLTPATSPDLQTAHSAVNLLVDDPLSKFKPL